ncbi:hypothetical protein RF11_12777 [Thelohanellus kitauei]|uniref:General transcription factor II-I repeat domain-containing protein 2 n=1 Tax=Thelohanellus kitauei TaxID=669202 RepID=A0A0C2I7Y4_THEKT|nr:hypothetical protein RF11_12777 [Thelohanellus kitauei]
MTRRVEELSSDVLHQLRDHIENCTFFRMAMDESNDISDTTQVAVFVREINDNFDSLNSTTKWSDLSETLKALGEKNNIEWGKFVSICTDGAPVTMGSKSECLTLLEQFTGRPILKYHYILHQEALCRKTLNLKNVMDVVVRCVSKIRSSDLNRRENEENYGYIVKLNGFQKEKYFFLFETDEIQTEREYILIDDWLNDLAFMVDIISHLNSFNERLQRKDKLFKNLFDEVYAFKMKLRLFIRQFTKRFIDALPTLEERLLEKTLNVLQYRSKLVSLPEAFESRFDEFLEEKYNVALHKSFFVSRSKDLTVT